MGDQLRFAVSLGIVGIAILGFVRSTQAGAIVIANRSESAVQFNVARPGESPVRYALQPRDLIPVETSQEATLQIGGGQARVYVVEPNSVYFFHDTPEGSISLERVGLAQVSAAPTEDITAIKADVVRDTAVIPVKILVDDDQVGTRAVWERLLKRRVAAVSEVLYAHCRVRLEVVAVDTWETDDGIRDFQQTLLEFEAEVDPAPAALAIGFSSQYHHEMRPDGRLGGTRGPLHSHILIREWTRVVREPQRMEVLLHEVGHYLGAAHSPEYDSVMRPKLGDLQANAQAFRIGFDPVNTLALYLIGLELRSRDDVPMFRELSMPVKLQLYRIYSTLAIAMPEDPAPRVNLRRLGPVALNVSNLRDRALNAVVPSGDEDDKLERLD